MKYDKFMRKITLKHIYYGLIFVSLLVIRTIAAEKLAATNTEAEIFINLTNSTGDAGWSGSMLYQLLTKPLIALLGHSNLILRCWTILPGALVTLLPLLYEDILGKRTALILSILLALDPFQTANGILADGNALTMLTLFAAFGFFLRKKYGLGTTSFIAFLFSGPNVQYGIVLIFMIAAITAMFGLRGGYIKALKDIIQHIRKKLINAAVIVFLAALLLSILKISFSDIFSQLILILQNWQKLYAVGSYPQLFPQALLSYLPIFLVSIYPEGRLHLKREVIIALYLGLLVMLLFVSLYPGHAVVDLVWVSLPVCLICAFKINNLIEKYHEFTGKIHIYTILLSILLVSLAIHFGLLVYKLQYGINWINELLSITTLLILIVMVIVFTAYNESLMLAVNTAGTGFLAVILAIQLTFTWRSTGLNGNPAAEILWGGYFEGDQTVNEIITNADLVSIDTGLVNEVALLDDTNAAVEWAVGQDYPIEAKYFGLDGEQYAVVITDSSSGLDGSVVDGYFGQNFIALSYPAWTWQPIKNLGSSDFWAWLIWRRNEQISIYHYIWLDKNLFQ